MSFRKEEGKNVGSSDCVFWTLTCHVIEFHFHLFKTNVHLSLNHSTSQI